MLSRVLEGLGEVMVELGDRAVSERQRAASRSRATCTCTLAGRAGERANDMVKRELSSSRTRGTVGRGRSWRQLRSAQLLLAAAMLSSTRSSRWTNSSSFSSPRGFTGRGKMVEVRLRNVSMGSETAERVDGSAPAARPAPASFAARVSQSRPDPDDPLKPP